MVSSILCDDRRSVTDLNVVLVSWILSDDRRLGTELNVTMFASRPLPELPVRRKTQETTTTLSSVPERRASVQRAGARTGERNGNHQTQNGAGGSSENQPLVPAPNRPPTPDRVSSIRDVRGLYTIEERDQTEEEGNSADESLDSQEPYYVWSPVTDRGTHWRRG